MMWLDPTGRMCGRVLCITGVPLMPTGTVLRTLLDVHDTVVTKEPAAEGHLALALCRPGDAEISEADDEWTEALHDYLDDQLGGTWSLHLAAGDRLTPLAQPLTWTFRRGLHLDLFQAAVDLGRLS